MEIKENRLAGEGGRGGEGGEGSALVSAHSP